MADIILECKPDEALIKALGYSRKMIFHQPDKGRVFNYLEKHPGAIGIVDEDPGAATPKFFSEFAKAKVQQFDIDYYHLKNKPTRLLVIKPRLEEWILKQAASSGVDSLKFSLPNNGHQLHKVINTLLPKFGEFLIEMMNKESKALVYMKTLIEEK